MIENGVRKKLTGYRRAIGVTRGLIGDDYMHMYSHF